MILALITRLCYPGYNRCFLAVYKDKMSVKEVDDFLAKANKASKEIAEVLKKKNIETFNRFEKE